MGADSSSRAPKIQYIIQQFQEMQNQPCRCLWRGSLQITRTAPWRRITLQFLHNFLTEALTFMALP
jgi:hypothetical protein